jgi:hypothetical protein
MNIILITMLGLVLAPIILILIQKTVKQLKIKKLLNEVTHELVKNPLCLMEPVTGVAREVVSPNIKTPQVIDGMAMKFSGGTTSFIQIKVGESFLENIDPFETVSIAEYRRNKKSKPVTCLVYKNDDKVFVKFKNGKTYCLGVISKSAGLKLIHQVRAIARGKALIRIRSRTSTRRLELAAI